MKEILITNRLVIRDFDLDDGTDMLHILSNNELLKYMDMDAIQNINEANEWINSNKNLIDGKRCAVELVDEKKVIGSVGYLHLNEAHRFASLSYFIHPDYQRRGYGYEALMGIIDHCFKKTTLNRLEAQIHTENEASQKLLEKIGFIKEGELKENFLIGNHFNNSYLYALLKRDWKIE